jgi:hypothetical protein
MVAGAARARGGLDLGRQPVRLVLADARLALVQLGRVQVLVPRRAHLRPAARSAATLGARRLAAGASASAARTAPARRARRCVRLCPCKAHSALHVAVHGRRQALPGAPGGGARPLLLRTECSPRRTRTRRWAAQRNRSACCISGLPSDAPPRSRRSDTARPAERLQPAQPGACSAAAARGGAGPAPAGARALNLAWLTANWSQCTPPPPPPPPPRPPLRSASASRCSPRPAPGSGCQRCSSRKPPLLRAARHTRRSRPVYMEVLLPFPTKNSRAAVAAAPPLLHSAL